MAALFSAVKRQSFREYFQPSRILLLIVRNEAGDKVNITTLCFVSHAGYKPLSIMFALEKRHYSYELMQQQKKCVLAVPGRQLAKPTMLCGTQSGRKIDKGRLADMPLVHGSSAGFVWIEPAIANLEAVVEAKMDSGDHDVFVAEVQAYYVSRAARGPNLLSIGKDGCGYELLERSGIHRIGVVSRDHD